MKVENLYTKDCIRTRSGIYINVFEPHPDMIDIKDIAHSLSYQCRFGGHLEQFYSVAQHSLVCSYLIEERELKLAALLHDASEAYLLDIPRPIKLRLPDYRIIEDGLMRVIADKFQFEYPLHPKVKEVDEIALKHEWDAYMIGNVMARDNIKQANEIYSDFLKMFKFYKA